MKPRGAAVEWSNLSKVYGAVKALDAFSASIAAGELFFLLGPSGCGKTTLLRILAGFVAPDSGAVYFDKENVTAWPPRRRGASMVFQNYALWPHRTAARNISYGLETQGLGANSIKERVDAMLGLVRMEGLGERFPAELSGGQQQRVALARALVTQPRLVLLDEPLSHLDAALREELREEIRRLHRETGVTMVYVTHDRHAALSLANRIGLMNAGRLIQVGTPREIYEHPHNALAAKFLGEINLIPGTIKHIGPDGIEVETAHGLLIGRSPDSNALKADMAAFCGIRPAAWRFGDRGNGPNCRRARIDQVVFLGDHCQFQAYLENNVPLVLQGPGNFPFKPGELVNLEFPIDQVLIIPDG